MIEILNCIADAKVLVEAPPSGRRKENHVLHGDPQQVGCRANPKLERLRRALLSSALKQCRMADSKHKRVRCEKRAKKQYGSAKSR